MRSEHSVLFVSKPKLTGTGLMRGGQIAGVVKGWDWTGSRQIGKRYDVMVGVKRWNPDWCKVETSIRVFDPLDFWPQTVTGAEVSRVRDEQSAIDFFRVYVERMKFNPDGFVFVTRRMNDVLSRAFPDKPSVCVYHHHDPAVVVNPVREKAQTIVFEGLERNLGEWRQRIELVARKFGMTFVVNPSPTWGQSLALGDIAVSVRSAGYDSYLSQQFKSNVKLANAYASGTPCIMWPEQGTIETATEDVKLFKTEDELASAIDQLRPYEVRKAISDRFRKEARKYNVEACAGAYDKFFTQLRMLHK